jgi:hypothetical protein
MGCRLDFCFCVRIGFFVADGVPGVKNAPAAGLGRSGRRGAIGHCETVR